MKAKNLSPRSWHSEDLSPSCPQTRLPFAPGSLTPTVAQSQMPA